MTIGARASAEDRRGRVRVRGVGLARPLSRGGAAEAAPPTLGRPSPLPPGRWWPAVTRPPGTAVAHLARVRLARPTVPTILSP